MITSQGECSAVMGEVSKFIPFPSMEDVVFYSTWESTGRIGRSNCCATSWFRSGFMIWFGLGLGLGFELELGLYLQCGLWLGIGYGLGLGYELELE